ncbi:MAG TPA: hypothetical protein PKV80_27890, partial [Leptospiraceae bacterium]|nr:hypothetical protein [Leptospiraceae bacterium]
YIPTEKHPPRPLSMTSEMERGAGGGVRCNLLTRNFLRLTKNFLRLTQTKTQAHKNFSKLSL